LLLSLHSGGVLASNSNIVSRGFPRVLLSPEKMKKKFQACRSLEILAVGLEKVLIFGHCGCEK